MLPFGNAGGEEVMGGGVGGGGGVRVAASVRTV